MQKTDSFIQVDIFAPQPMYERVIAALLDEPFEGFEEQADRIVYYIEAEKFDAKQLQRCLSSLGREGVSFKTLSLDAENWNKRWETHYDPVSVGNFCHIRAPFHNKPSTQPYTHELLIQPQMSFGTGHHETSRLMIRLMQHVEMRSKSVLDMGCGTGILGILAAKMGAKYVLGIDIDPWSYDNALENIKVNDISQMKILLGNVAAIPSRTFDCILANINLDVLQRDIPQYLSHLQDEGYLLISGFYQSDLQAIQNCFAHSSMALIHHFAEANWQALAFRKQQ